ncbi:hypothetical protein [Erwinia sp. OPT-41]|uniref:Helix-turn-helix domain-containing protein n=1 Tax=Erwinia plantamica TaxID=3237104 RepID=A0ABW7CL91_9GAMM
MEAQIKNMLFGITNRSEIARRIKTSPQNVSSWLKKGKFPPYYVIPLCAALDWGITPHQVDPQLYPNATDGLPPGQQHIESDEGNLIHENQHGRKQGTDRPRN